MPIEEVPMQLEKYGLTPFLLTTRADGRPHPSSVSISWREGEATVAAGRGAIANISTHDNVVLLFAPLDGVGHSMLIDGHARTHEANGETVMLVRAISAVLHRQAGLTAAE